MAQLSVYRNPNPDSRDEVPYLVDVQSDLLSQLATRVVIPLYRKGAAGLAPMTRLTPEVEIEGETCLLMTPQLAGVPLRALGEQVGNLTERRTEVITALDLLITGF